MTGYKQRLQKPSPIRAFRVFRGQKSPFWLDGVSCHTVTGSHTFHVISEGKCDSLIVGGTSGEFNAMSLDERLELFRVVKDAAAGRVPLVAGACSDSTREVVRLAQEGEALGFDAVMALGPCYCKPTQMSDFRHVTPDDFTIYNGDDIMVLCGLEVGPPRLPLAPATADEVSIMRSHLERLGIL